VCVAVASAGAQRAFSADGAWSGAAGAAWTNDANWSASPYPGGADTATFNGAGNGNTVVDLGGLAGILNVTFAGSGVAGYTLGTSGVSGQTLVVGDGGLVQVAEDAGNSQTVNAAVRLGPDTAAGSYQFRNDSASRTLTFAGGVAGAAEGGVPGVKTVTISGAGHTVLNGVVSDGGTAAIALVSAAQGTVMLAGANTYSGGTVIQSGVVTASHNQALGVGPVANDGVLDLTVGAVTYSGLSVSLSGAGTVNVKLGTGTALNPLDGDYSGFNGVWNLGVGSSAGRARMNGADHAAATVHVLSNASLLVDGPVVKTATAILYGGDICDQAGQLRLENGAEWAGPVIFAGDITDANDGSIGNNSGTSGTVSGPISDLNGPHPFQKRLTGTLALTATNSTYAGWTWCRGGTLSVRSLGNLGEPSSLGAPLTAGNNVLKLGSSDTTATLIYTGTGDVTDRAVDLSGSTGGAILEQRGGGTLALTGDLTCSGVGAKTLTLRGSTAGVGELGGALANGAGSTVSMVKSGTGTWVLSGASTFTGETTVQEGVLSLSHPNALSGTSRVLLQGTAARNVVLEWAYDSEEEAARNVTLAAGYRGTLATKAGTDHALNELAMSSATVTVARSESVLSGTPRMFVRTLNLSGGSSHTATVNPTTAELLVGRAAILSNSQLKTLQLNGTSHGNVITGAVYNGLNTLSLGKGNTGTWTLEGENTYSGATSVDNGVLVVAGANGAIVNTSTVTIQAGGTLRLTNSAALNHTDRLGDAAPLALAGGALEYAHDGTDADFNETLGAVTVSDAGSVIRTSQAGVEGTSVLTLASLGRSGLGAVNFEGDGLGDDARNRILIANQPEGLIGSWATCNGSQLAFYDSVRGVYGAELAETEIAARGPASVIPDDPDAHVRITQPGTDGPITLGGDPLTRVALLTQETETPAVVATASKTLRASGIAINEGQASLTFGEADGDGTLTALAEGGILQLDNRSSSPLTVNAAVADHTSASALVKGGEGEVVLKNVVGHTGPTAISAGTLTLAGHAVPQTLAGAVSGDGTLAKSGTNVLSLLGANTYTGPTYINAGLVRVDQNTAFGSPAGGVFIADGATLDLGCTPDVGGTRGIDTLNLQAEEITVQGSGLFGQGAIVNQSAGSQSSALGKVVLAGDATFGAASRWDIRNGTLTLNDHGLTLLGPNTVALYSANVDPGAGGQAHIEVQGGQLRMLHTTKLNGGAANTLTVSGGASLEFYQVSNPQAWGLVLEDGAALNFESSTMSTHNRWSGPVTLNGEVTLNGTGTTVADLQGEISGPGSVIKGTTSYTTFSGTNNTYTGSTTVLGTRLYATSLRNVGEPSSLGQPPTAEAGTIKLGSGGTAAALAYIGAGDTTDRVIGMAGTSGSAVLYQNGTGPLKFTSDVAVSTAGNKTLILRGTGAVAAEIAGAVANAPGSVIAVTKDDSGSWVLSGDNTYSGVTTVTGGGALTYTGDNTLTGSVTVSSSATLTVSGTNRYFNAITVTSGTLLLTGTVSQTTGICYVNGSSTANAVLRMAPGSLMTGSGGFTVGRSGGYSGAFYLNGGTFIRNTGTTDGEYFCFGGFDSSGYGYLQVTDGTLTTPRLQLGPRAGSALGIGIARITGGTCTLTANMHISRITNSIGVLTLDGGLFDRSAATTECNIGYSGGRGELNITGGTFDNSGRNIFIRNNSNNSTGIINLCAGTLKVNAFQINAPGVAWLNGLGGTLKAATTGQTIIPSGLTGVHSYGPFGGYTGGLAIDTDGKNVTVAKPIQAPAGSGVYAIAVADGGSGYIGEPYVSIRGGGGEGATAVADMEDDGTGNGTYRVAGVTVTCPGFGYTETPTVTLLGGGTGATSAAVAGVTLAPNASGGLTKLGAGMLTLSVANAYTGTTTVAGGTLKLTNAKALPTQTPIVLAGGTLDLNGYTVTNAVSGSGIVSNGTLRTEFSPAGAGVIGTDAFTLTGGATLRATSYLADVNMAGGSDRVAVTGSIDLSDTALTLVDPNLLNRQHQYTLVTCTGTRTGKLTVPNPPDSRWHLAYLADGTVKLLFVDGTLIKVR
jgi:autotransporter-associated beta strand protein